MREMMYYFGILFQMSMQDIRERTKLLKEFLELSTADALCKTLRLVAVATEDIYSIVAVTYVCMTVLSAWAIC